MRKSCVLNLEVCVLFSPVANSVESEVLVLFITLVVLLENGSSKDGKSNHPPLLLLALLNHRWVACLSDLKDTGLWGAPPPSLLILVLDTLRVDPGSLVAPVHFLRAVGLGEEENYW